MDGPRDCQTRGPAVPDDPSCPVGELVEQSGNDRVVVLALDRRRQLALEQVRNFDQLRFVFVFGDERDGPETLREGVRRLRRGS